MFLLVLLKNQISPLSMSVTKFYYSGHKPSLAYFRNSATASLALMYVHMFVF